MDDVVVLVRHQSEWLWYVTDPDVWYLDQHQLAADFRLRGYEVRAGYPDTFGLAVVNEGSAATYLKHLEAARVDTQLLREAICRADASGDLELVEELMPGLFIDFDARVLYSTIPEGTPHTSYVPSGWNGVDDEFLALIPASQRYWREVEGHYRCLDHLHDPTK